MNKILMSGLLIVVALSFQNCRTENASEIKVMAWNIWHGGNDESLPSDGRPSVVNIIRDSGADIVLMIETYGSAPYIADSLGFEYYLISSNLCIFSRFPIKDTYSYPDRIAAFNFGGVKVTLSNGQDIILYDAWLHYLPDTRLVPTQESEESILAWENEGSRDDEISAIVNSISHHISNSDSVPVIMGGDFNSFSHIDWTESTRHLYNHGGAVVNWTISRTLTNAGFIDTYRYINPHTNSDPGTTWLSGINEKGERGSFRQDRIDYIYSIGEKLRIINSEIYNAEDGDTLIYMGKKYMYPSDHGFVLTTFSVSN